MSHILESKAALRIIGDTLVPDEITALLGCQPSASEVKGQIIRSAKTGTERTCKRGMWRLCARDSKLGDLDGQIADLLEKTTKDLEIWTPISSKYRVDLFCGLFMEKGNEGLQISPEMLKGLERGITLSLDVYGPDPD